MNTYTPEQLQEIVRKNGAWLRGEEGGKRADLSNADLSNADLSNADLYGANLYGANLYGANLSSANLSSANLSSANLSGADLYGANLSYADLSNANLRYADLYGITVNWNSHALLSEILFRASEHDLGRQALAALIARHTDWFWDVWTSDDAPEGVDHDDWLGIVVDHREWALSELAKWVKDGDNAPDAVRQYAGEEAQA